MGTSSAFRAAPPHNLSPKATAEDNTFGKGPVISSAFSSSSLPFCFFCSLTPLTRLLFGLTPLLAVERFQLVRLDGKQLAYHLP